MPMSAVRRLVKTRDDALTGELRAVTTAHGHRGVFNPSLSAVPGVRVLAYRALPAGSSAIHSYLAIQRARDAFEVIDLTALGAAARGIPRVADPKLVQVQDQLVVTFNSGFVASGRNDIYLMRVAPDLGPIQRVETTFERQAVEKNWAFFSAAEHGLSAMYQLHPYSEVHLVHGELGAAEELVFTRRVPARAKSGPARGLSIGTQAIRAEATSPRHILVAHEKWNIPRRSKRMYFGRAVSVIGAGTDDVTVNVGSERVIHSWRDAMPRRQGVHNRNLMSATYFSGLMRVDDHDDDVLLGYGVNDAAFSIARVSERDFWH